jgi:hypothetical protein
MKRAATPFAVLAAATLFCAGFFGGPFLQSGPAHAEEPRVFRHDFEFTIPPTVDKDGSSKSVQPGNGAIQFRGQRDTSSDVEATLIEIPSMVEGIKNVEGSKNPD